MNNNNIKVKFRYDGDLFYFRRLKSKNKVLTKYIRKVQCTDDIAIFRDSPIGFDSLQQTSKKNGYSINIKKTEICGLDRLLNFSLMVKNSKPSSAKVSGQSCNR